MIYGTLMNMESTQKFGIYAIPNSKRTTTHGLFMGRWPMDHNSSHIKIGNNLARSMVVYVQMRSEESKAAMGQENPKYKLHIN